jgi:hypothetical protein
MMALSFFRGKEFVLVRCLNDRRRLVASEAQAAGYLK